MKKNNFILKKLFLLVLIIGFVGCKNDKKINRTLPSLDRSELILKYAKGFSVVDYGQYKILKINSPWPKSEKTYTYLLLTKEQAMVSTFNKDDYDAIITIPIEKIVVTSTTHIPALEL